MSPNLETRLSTALQSGNSHELGPEDIDELLLLLGKFETDDSYVSNIINVSGGEASAKRKLLILIDEVALFDENSLSYIFGRDTIANQDRHALKQRFARLSRVFHPDRGFHDSDWLTQRMSLINNAHSLAEKVFDGDIENPENATRPGFNPTPQFDTRKRRRKANIYNDDKEGLSDEVYKFAFKFLNGSNFDQIKKLVFGLIALVIILILTSFFSQRQNQTNDHTNIIATDFLQKKPTNPPVHDQNEPFLTQSEINNVVDDLLNELASHNKPELSNGTETIHKPIDPDLLDWVREQRGRDQASKPLESSASRPSNVATLNSENTSADAMAMIQSQGNPDEAVHGILSELGETSPKRKLKSVEQFIASLESAYENKDLDTWINTFTPDASYYDTVGRLEIAKERREFFQSIESPTARFTVHEFKLVGDVFFLVADVESSFFVSETKISRCIPSVLVLTEQVDDFKIIRWNKRAFNLNASQCPS